MKISVVTVSFNSATTVVDTLRSVAAQTHPDIEHIVIDGGSTDNTVALVRQHGSRVVHLVSERDGGIYDAMNKGLALATGDLVGFLNADDVYAEPGSVAALAAEAARSGAEAVYGDLVYVREDDLTAVVRMWRSGAFRPHQLRLGWMPPHPTLYVRRSTMQTLGGFNAGLRIAADYDFVLRCLGRPGATAAYLPKVLVRMRTGGASNRSLRALLQKSREDLQALHNSGVGGIFALLCKNARKLPQFFRRERSVLR